MQNNSVYYWEVWILFGSNHHHTWYWMTNRMHYDCGKFTEERLNMEKKLMLLGRTAESLEDFIKPVLLREEYHKLSKDAFHGKRVVVPWNEDLSDYFALPFLLWDSVFMKCWTLKFKNRLFDLSVIYGIFFFLTLADILDPYTRVSSHLQEGRRISHTLYCTRLYAPIKVTYLPIACREITNFFWLYKTKKSIATTQELVISA